MKNMATIFFSFWAPEQLLWLYLLQEPGLIIKNTFKVKMYAWAYLTSFVNDFLTVVIKREHMFFFSTTTWLIYQREDNWLTCKAF